jgi:hypothetical protein
MRRDEYLHYAPAYNSRRFAEKKFRHVIFIQSNNGGNEMNRNPSRTAAESAMHLKNTPTLLMPQLLRRRDRLERVSSQMACMDLHAFAPAPSFLLCETAQITK